MFITAWYWMPLLEAGSYLRLEYLELQPPLPREHLVGARQIRFDQAYEQNWTFLNLVGKGIVVAQSILSLFIILAQ